MEAGQRVRLVVGEELKLDTEHVTTLLQRMVVQVVQGLVLRLSLAIHIIVQVQIAWSRVANVFLYFT